METLNLRIQSKSSTLLLVPNDINHSHNHHDLSNNANCKTPLLSSLPVKLREDIKYLLDHLTKDELEIMARSSYVYQKISNMSSSIDLDSLRLTYALKMAQRYLSSKSNKVIALQRIQDTVQFRIEQELSDMDQLTSKYAKDISNFLFDKKSYVQGYDNDGRSTYIFIPRRVTDHSNASRTLRGHLWSLEKAIASTKCQDGTINVIVDFSGFILYAHSPPLQVGKELMTILRNHYVGHIHKIFLVNVPTSFSILWSIFKPFAGTKTKNKIVFVNGPTNNRSENNILKEYYTKDEATPWMIDGGKKSRELDVDQYINEILFDESFDGFKTQ